MPNQQSGSAPIRAQLMPDGTLDVRLYGEIGGYGEDSDERICAARISRMLTEHRSAQLVRVLINSPGGDAFEGLAIHNLLRSFPVRVEVSIEAYALSAASLIAMAGDHIRIANNGLLMIHDPWTLAIGNGEDLLEAAEKLDKMADVMARTYAARCGKPVEDVRRMMATETWLNADDALAEGFVDEVDEPAMRIAACAPSDSLMARYRAAPDKLRALLGTEATEPKTDTVSAQANAPALPGNEVPMSELLQKLGATTEADALAVVAAADEFRAAVFAQTDTKDPRAALDVIAQLKAQADESVKLAARLAEVEADGKKRDREATIARMSEDGRLPPSMHGWARSLSDEQLAAYEAVAPSAQAPATPPANNDVVVLTEEDEALIKANGTDRAAFIALRKRELARKA